MKYSKLKICLITIAIITLCSVVDSCTTREDKPVPEMGYYTTQGNKT